MGAPQNEPSIFAGVLDLPLSELAFPNGDGLLEKQILTLEKFTESELPESVVAQATDLITLSRLGHSTCENFTAIAEKVAGLPDLDLRNRLAMASLALDAQDSATLPESAIKAEVLERIRGERRTVLGLILAELANGKMERSVGDLIEQSYVDEAEVRRSIAEMQAVLLVAKQEQLATAVKLLPPLAELGLIWRGLFYGCIVGDKGSALERDLTAKKTQEKIEDALKQLNKKLLGLALGRAILAFEAAKSLYGLYTTLRNKEAHLDGVIKQLKSAQEYLDAYSQALHLWVPVATAITNMSVEFLTALAIRADEAGRH
jgi:hypothetical protein